jgi:hypothetical protein
LVSPSRAVRPQGVLLLYGFTDARLGALSSALHQRGLLLVRAETVESATLLLDHVKVRAIVLATEAERTALVPLARKKRAALLIDPQLEPVESAEKLLAALT